MAFEYRASQPFSLEAASTGLKPRRFMCVDSNGRLAYAVSGKVADFVSLTGSTGSTEDYQQISVLPLNGSICRIDAPASTVGKGDLIMSSSVGKVAALSAGSCLGKVVGGTSGTTRCLSVLVYPPNSTAAPANS